MKKRILSILLTLSMLLTIISITPTVMADDVKYVLVGQTSLFTTGWDSEGSAYVMTKSTDGTYQYTLSAASACGAVEFQVVKIVNGAPTEFYGNAINGNMKMYVTGTSAITISFNPTTSEITVSGNDVSLTGTSTFTCICSKSGYTFEVFQLATFNEGTQDYTALATNSDVLSKIQSINTQLASQTTLTYAQIEQIVELSGILTACDNANTSDLGTSCGSWLTTGADKSFTLSHGLYYIKCTGTPFADAEVRKNSVIALNLSGKTIDLSNNVSDGSEPDIDITFGDGTTNSKYVTYADTISYTVKSELTGTASNKLTGYDIYLHIGSGLDLDSVSLTSVKLGGTTDCSYTANKDTSSSSVKISLADDVVGDDDFYRFQYVEVKFTAKLAHDAPVNTNITTLAKLDYTFINQTTKSVLSSGLNVLTATAYTPLTPAFTITDGNLGTDYTYDLENGVLTVLTPTPLTIANVDPTTPTDHRIVVKEGVNANITLAGVNIAVSGGSPFDIEAGSKGNVTITLKDGTTNTLDAVSSYNRNGGAALKKEGGGTDIGKLTIQGGTLGTGKLIVKAGYGAGIGGNETMSASSSDVSNITITGGIVTVTSIASTGIGSGSGENGSGAVSDISITGGIVTVTSSASTGIGSGDAIFGSSGAVSNISITGGVVTATSGDDSAGIGSGYSDDYSGSVSNITITGGSVKASSLGCTPNDGKGNNVYLVTISNPDEKSVIIDGKLWTPFNHTALDPTDTNLYAYSTTQNATAHTVTFDDGTSTTTYLVVGKLGDNTPAVSTAPTNSTFLGWYEKNANGAFKDTAFDFANTAVTSDITLYAKWETLAKDITLGYSALHDADTTNAKWDYVYFGTYNSNPIKWRVLSTNGSSTTTGTGTTDTATYKTPDGTAYTGKALFILSENTLFDTRFYGTSSDNEWLTSNLRDKMQKNIFASTSAELKYVLKTTKTDSSETIGYMYNGQYSLAWNESSLSDDTLFALSAREVEQYLGNVTSNRVSGNVVNWFLRSPYKTHYVGGINLVGSAGILDLDDDAGVRPALNLDSSKILFTSAAVGGKTSATVSADGTTGIFANTDIAISDGYKLTLLDESRSSFTASLKSLSGNTATVSYYNATPGTDEYISVIIKNGDTVKYYGRVAHVTSASGDVDITLPIDYNAANGDVLCVFNEQYNGDKNTDYASRLIDVTPFDYTVNFNANGGEGTMTSQTMTTGIASTLSANTFTRNGCTFIGWNTKSDGNGTAYSDGQSVTNLVSDASTPSVTLYAQWKDITAPVITGIEVGKTYCIEAKFKVTDNVVGISSVVFENGGQTTMLTADEDGYYTIKAAPGSATFFGTVIAEDTSGNRAMCSIFIKDRHVCNWKDDGTYYWQECENCTFTTNKKPIPSVSIDIKGADKACRMSEYVFSFEVPDGCKEPTGYIDLHGKSSEKDPVYTVEGNVMTITVPADSYDNAESFDAIAIVLLEDDYPIEVSKTVFIQNEHTGGTATCTDRAVCTVCGEPYGEFNHDNHTGGTEVRGAYPSTCETDGYTGDTWCLGCETVVEYGTAIPAYGHSFAIADAGDGLHHINICTNNCGLVITSEHIHINGTCIACGHTVEIDDSEILDEDEVVIDIPVESQTEEIDTDDTTEKSPKTGITFGLSGVALCIALAVISKK